MRRFFSRNNKPDKPPVKGLAKAPEPPLVQLKNLLRDGTTAKIEDDALSSDTETDANFFGASFSSPALSRSTVTWKTFSTPAAPTGHTQLLPLPSPYGGVSIAALIRAQQQIIGCSPYASYWDTGAPVPKLQTENKFGEIEAFRIWEVKDAILYSVYARTPWEPGKVLKAHKPVQDDDSLNETLPYGRYGMLERTGVHAFKSLYIAIHYGLEDEQTFHSWLYAVGKVKLWGDVVEHDRGYRAEFARIVEIVEVIDSQGTPYPDCAKVVRKRYLDTT